MNNVYEFSTTKDFFASRFRGHGSVRVHTRRLGYSSPRLLEMVMKGDRVASDDFLFRTRSRLNLTDQEFLYLNLLLRRDRLRAKGKSDPQLDSEISSFSRLARDQAFLDEKMYRLVSDWPHFVLKQYFNRARENDPERIAQILRHKISAPQVKKVIRTLADLGIIYVDEKAGMIRPRLTAGFVSQTDVPSQAVRSHHKQMMERAKEALEEIPLREREIVSLTFSFDRKNLEAVKAEIRAFKDRIDSRYAENEAEDVFQLNLQFFPHTENRK